MPAGPNDRNQTGRSQGSILSKGIRRQEGGLMEGYGGLTFKRKKDEGGGEEKGMKDLKIILNKWRFKGIFAGLLTEKRERP